MLLAPDSSTPTSCDDLSNERQVTADTPPTFLFHTDADTGVPAENSVAFYLALRKAKVPAELHIYEPGPHGVGLGGTDPALVDVAGPPRRLAAHAAAAHRCTGLNDARRPGHARAVRARRMPLADRAL